MQNLGIHNNTIDTHTTKCLYVLILHQFAMAGSNMGMEQIKKEGEIQPAARIRRLILHKSKELPGKRSAVILQNCTKYQTRAAEDPFTTTTKSAAAHEAGGPQLFAGRVG